jgi:GNAT superfamily N-acetyltransferase
MKKLNEKDFKTISQLNVIGFGFDDTYSSPTDIRDYLIEYPEETGLILERVKGEIAGFLFWEVEEDSINTIRRAVDPKYRGLGFGVSLTRKVIQLGEDMGCYYNTYCATDNLASINSNIKCGCFVTSISENWICLSTQKRGR